MRGTLNAILVTAAVAAVLAVGIFLVAHRGSLSATRGGRDANAAAASSNKQFWHCGMHPQVIQDHPGDCPICHMALTPIPGTGGGPSTAPNQGAAMASADRKVLYWWDPMLGSSSITDKPGKSAMGMDLVPVYVDAAGPDVQIDPRVVQNMGVRTAEVTRGPLTRTVRTFGLLSLPEPGLHDVTLRVNGWIDKLYADQVGMRVARGEPLFEVYSPELQVASQELIGAERALRALPPDAGEVVRKEARGLAGSARRKLRLWDVGEEEIEAIARAEAPPRDIVFRSPATGHVEEKMVVQGSSVQPGMKLLRVADHTTMWLDLQVYEGQIPFVQAGQRVVATLDALPGRTFTGAVSFVYPHLDHATRTLKVRATLENPKFELKPGMYATAEIAAEPIADAVLCPREAVIDTGKRQIAFVAEGGGHFAPRNVRVGATGDGDRVQILEGLAPGETVVTSGQFLMDVESRTIEAARKLSGEGRVTP